MLRFFKSPAPRPAAVPVPVALAAPAEEVQEEKEAIPTQRRASVRIVVDLAFEYWAEVVVGEAGAEVSATLLDGHGTEEKPVRGVIHDLSTGGMRIHLAHMIPMGVRIHARYEVPKDVRESFRSKRMEHQDTIFGPRRRPVVEDKLRFDELSMVGDIVSEFPMTDGKPGFAYGVRFVDLSEGEAEKIARLCHLWQLRQLQTQDRRRR